MDTPATSDSARLFAYGMLLASGQGDLARVVAGDAVVATLARPPRRPPGYHCNQCNASATYGGMCPFCGGSMVPD